MQAIWSPRGISMENDLRTGLENAMRSVLEMPEDTELEKLMENIWELIDEKNRIDDDDVEPSLRGVLYFMERHDLLKMDITEKHIKDGRVWKNHYWVLNEEMIGEMTSFKEKRTEEKPDHDGGSSIYRRLSENLWNSYLCST